MGVLFVHGVGTRRPSQALAAAAEPFSEFLRAWTEAAGGRSRFESVVLTPAVGGSSQSTAGPEVVLSVQMPRSDPQRWVLREAWWGGLLSAPGFASMLLWSWIALFRSEWQIVRPLVRSAAHGVHSLSDVLRNVGDVGEAAAAGIANAMPAFDPTVAAVAPLSPDGHPREEAELRIALEMSPPKQGMLAFLTSAMYGPARTSGPMSGGWVSATNFTIIGLVLTVASMLLIPAATVAVIAVAACLLPVTVLATLLISVAAPFPRLGKWARKAQDALRSSVGDAFIWERRPLLRAAILTSVRADLESLAAECEHIAVVAHSQGAAIVYELLAKEPDVVPTNLELLITYGQGIRRLSPRRSTFDLDATWSNDFRWLDFSADRDPVSVEPLPASPVRCSQRISNLRSVIRDHSAYWKNDEQFVAPVILAVGQLGCDTPDTTQALDAGTSRRRKRTLLLTASRVCAVVFVLGVTVLFEAEALRQLARGADAAVKATTALVPAVDDVGLPGARRSGPWATLVGLAVVVVATTLWSGLLDWLWGWWDGVERGRFRRHTLQQDPSLPGLCLVLYLATPFIAMAVLLVAWSSDARFEIAESLSVVLALGLVISFVVWSVAMPPSAKGRRRISQRNERQRRELEDALRRGLAEFDALPEPARQRLLIRFREDPNARISTMEAALNRMGMR